MRELLEAELGLGGRMKRRSYRTLAGKTHVYEVEYDDGRIVRVMNVKGTYQSATYMEEDCYELVFGYHKAYNAMFAACPADGGDAGFAPGVGARRPSDLARAPRASRDVPLIRKVAMLGGGGFSYPKYLVAHHPEVSVDVVEIDPMVVSIAERWFYLDRLVAEFDTDENGRLGVFVEDARNFLEEPGGRYDAIVNDCFSARVPAMALATVEAARGIHARLNPGGMYLTNVISALRGPRASLLHRVMATLQGEFAHVHVVPGSEGLPRMVDNYVVIATDGAYAFDHEIDVQPDPGTEVLVDAFVDDYEDEFFLTDA